MGRTQRLGDCLEGVAAEDHVGDGLAGVPVACGGQELEEVVADEGHERGGDA